MTVAELREALNQFDDEMEVWVSSDSEGNTYSEVEELTEEPMEDTDNEDLDDGLDDDSESGDVCLVIWPRN